MSFDQISALESQPTTMRSSDAYADDPEFSKLSQELMNKLFTLTGNISRLSNQVALLGTKRDTERVRERVHDLLEETKEDFKTIGEGVKKIQAWDDVSVSTQPQYSTCTRANIFVSHPRNTRNKNSPANSKPPSASSKTSNTPPFPKSAPLHPPPATPSRRPYHQPQKVPSAHSVSSSNNKNSSA